MDRPRYTHDDINLRERALGTSSNASVVRRERRNFNRAKRRPSIEIANDFIEMDFKALIDADRMASMSKRELRKFEKKRRKVAKNRHPLVRATLTLAALVLVASGCVYMWWSSSISPVDPKDTKTRQFDVDKGASTAAVANALKRSGFIRNTLAFNVYMKFHGGIIQAGTHMLSPSFDLGKVVKNLATAETDEVDITIPPGLTLKELRENFKKYDYTDDEIDEAFNKQYDSPVLADRPSGATLEGYLYPDTYRVYAGDDLSILIQKALDKMNAEVLSNDFQTKFKENGLNLHKGITLASIVTKEVTSYDDQRKVAGVFYRRLNAGMPLGSDTTFMYAYAQGLCDTNTSKCNSIYNTRIYKGLPPGPIDNPSLSALKAVADPEIGTAMYFVSGDDGKTYFSDTLDQHNQAVAAHCTKLCK